METTKRKKLDPMVYTPNQWEDIVKSASKKRKYSVVHMTPPDFLSIKDLPATNRKKAEDNRPVRWLELRWMSFKRTEPGKMFFKETLSPTYDFTGVSFAKQKKCPPSTEDYVVPLPQLYPEGRHITPEKKQDLMTLLKYVPPVHHQFYKDLKSAPTRRSGRQPQQEEVEPSAEGEEVHPDLFQDGDGEDI